MTYLKFFIIIPVVALAVYFYYFGVYRPKYPNYQGNQQVEESPTATKQWETKNDAEVPVAITITPIEFGRDAKQWRFIVVFDTHSGSLDQDPTKVILLEDDSGNIYQPIAWEGPGPGGHHREGVLLFTAPNPAPPSVALRIKDVGGIPERSFTWSLK